MAPVCSRPLASRRSSGDVLGAQLVASLLCLRVRHQAEERRFQQRGEAAKRRVRSIEQLLLANSFVMTAVAVHSLGTVERSRWRFTRNERWFEETLSHLGEAHFKRCFRVAPATFRYIGDACRADLTRQDTEMTEAVSVKKRVAVGLYRLCSTAEERTVAELFTLGRSTVNMIYKEFCVAVSDNLEDEYSIILLALVDHRYRFRYTNVGSPGRCHDAYVYGRSKLRKFVESEAFRGPTAEIEGMLVPPIILCEQLVLASLFEADTEGPLLLQNVVQQAQPACWVGTLVMQLTGSCRPPAPVSTPDLVQWWYLEALALACMVHLTFPARSLQA
ncbi:hypothetical protein HPB48_008385 [Haemaphysalis longicornis]|uniref:Uncharacterized protein n=1 Tax=Haemaphysalis longicornis TaxID=44386 RepID=A0A9J6FBQ9_HAELO|nr:hypothetical protein HPB48_008385 [Haemaphysalis longicornis]